MLILTRRISESVVIGNDVKVTVLGVGNQVRLGIDAPREISVHREEIYHKILQEEAELAKAAEAESAMADEAASHCEQRHE